MVIGKIGKVLKMTCCIPINTVGGVLFMGAVEIGACAFGGYVEEKVREKTYLAWIEKMKQEQLAKAKAAQEAEEDDEFYNDWDESDDEEDEDE